LRMQSPKLQPDCSNPSPSGFPIEVDVSAASADSVQMMSGALGSLVLMANLLRIFKAKRCAFAAIVLIRLSKVLHFEGSGSGFE
jgi:hypothetical protein